MAKALLLAATSAIIGSCSAAGRAFIYSEARSMAKDDIYAGSRGPAPFEFNERVAAVFDDMITRSVPGYRELIGRLAQLTGHFYRPGSCIYDLGCSNGNFGVQLCEEMADREFRMVAVDSSRSMLDIYDQRLTGLPRKGSIELICGDICDQQLKDASVVVITLTLQFLPLGEREALIDRIYRALRPGGVLLLTEKVVHPDPALDALQQDFYYRFKRERGYSELEISQKREALEDVLIPETIETHEQRLRQAGFRQLDLWFKWFNFAAFLACKEVA